VLKKLSGSLCIIKPWCDLSNSISSLLIWNVSVLLVHLNELILAQCKDPANLDGLGISLSDYTFEKLLNMQPLLSCGPHIPPPSLFCPALSPPVYKRTCGQPFSVLTMGPGLEPSL
jgi:hypothetical protein